MSNIKYRALLSAIEEGNLTAAAARLNYTQPGISHMIAALEKELGFSLLIRTKNGVVPTAEAQELIFHIRQLINSEDRILEISDKIKGVEKGIVRIGTFYSVSVYWLPKIIGIFESKYPNISLRLTEGDSSEIINGIREGILDLGFISDPGTEGVDFIPIQTDPIMAVLPANHPLADREVVDIHELTKYPFIYPSENSYEDIYKYIEGDDSIDFDIKYRVKGDEAILAMVGEGLGVSIMPKLLLGDKVHAGHIIKPLSKKYHRTLGIVVRSGKYASPAVKNFIKTALGGLERFK